MERFAQIEIPKCSKSSKSIITFCKLKTNHGLGTFIKLTDFNLKFASPNCSILKMKDLKERVINMPPLTYFGAAGMKATMLNYVSAPLAPLRSLL